ncbi:acetate/propionate family kinase [Dinoroseobacter sp. PD6]|uniref:acetate/propionate family kinase n=1 Tax=Dinoroseobacter sp. PD6 TaxID=3028384 RepID=UPI00237A6588|nr:acetate/propionate family kinase [Dinoroseobacter sp. PD6]MDD9719047.1 acetate/propionate family kinase [Dinoroseobacter sp. PD6]
MADPARSDLIIVLNAGSSSLKFALFTPALAEHLTGQAESIGGPGRLKIGARSASCDLPDHGAALAAILGALATRGITASHLKAVAHRVVHGGVRLTAPVRITPATRSEIAACSALAPLHNPHNLAAIDRITALMPDVPQCASFDTAFHASNPEVALRYGLPDTAETAGLRRYGFHGQSYAAMVDSWSRVTGAALPDRLLAFHLGSGASICAIRDGRSVATTMGYSPLEGLTMATRSGSIDGNAVLKLAEDHGIARARRILNNESGLAGLSGGLSDMRTLMASDRPEAGFAVDHFVYWAVRHASSLLAPLGGTETIAFTGGIGENAAEIRARIVAGLHWIGAEIDPEANAEGQTALHSAASATGIYIIPAEEERMLAADALRVLGA